MSQTLNFAPDASAISDHHTALRSAFLVTAHHGRRLTPEQLSEINSTDTLPSLLKTLRRAGFACRALKRRKWIDAISLGKAYPAMILGKTGRWVILVGTANDDAGEPTAAVLDPARETAGVQRMPRADFEALWSGIILLCKPKRRLLDENQPFGLAWFLPEIVRHGRFFRDVAIAAVASSLINLATPLFYHVLIDKVIPHHSYQTLLVIVLIFLLLTAFDAMFSYVRQQLMLFATNKIDVRLASRTFERLLGLPMQFFEHTTSGVLVRNLQQTEKLRQFLTGRLFQTLLDAAGLPILLVLLASYSAKLTFVVLAFAMAIAAIIALLIPTFRRRLNELYQAEGERQTHLVETINGMRTIKSLTMEGLRQQEWDDKVVTAVRRHAVVGRIASFAGALTGSLEKLMQLAVLALGSVDVFEGRLSMGALVAFTMLSGRVSGPLLQMAGLINEYQETAMSVRMLGTVMDHPPERDPNRRGFRPAITGEVVFDHVRFTYAGAASPALDDVSFTVKEGQVIGVVGRSGSGKTTVTRLIQGIHNAQDGAIQLNGADIRHIDLHHLRHNVGVVLQDSFLFRGTIRENIAATLPDAPLGAIVEAARMAGADEFIDRLPQSYETVLEEGASNLSGGQRQRIAIARALLRQPRLLIFDEATSALDPESEAVIQENLKDIARGRTMIIISHRLSSLVQSDAILVLDRGRAIDIAPHSVLVNRCAIYRHLWQQQTQHIHARPQRVRL
jgi:subfamily B ATP-binding cassette protein HlyB/CyaB